MKNILKAITVVALTFSTLACGSGTESATQDGQQQRQQGRQGQPDISALIKEMDTDSDGMLSKTEVKGPLAENFSSIDANSDGKLSETELKNAPKPQGGRPPRGN